MSKAAAWAFAILLLVVGLTSCSWFDLQGSAAPIYTKKDVVLDDRIVGVWHQQASEIDSEPGPGNYTIEKAAGTDHYLLTQTGSEIHLVRIGKQLFVDIERIYKRSGDSETTRDHMFGRIFMSRDVMTLRLLRPFKSPLDEKDLPLDISGWSTAQLQTFLVERSKDRNLFFDVGLCRDGIRDCDIAPPREVLKEEPDNVDAGYQLARAYMNRGRFDDAWSTWKRMLPLSRSKQSYYSPMYASYFAQSLISWGHRQSAIEVLKAESGSTSEIFHGCNQIVSGYLFVDQPRRVLSETEKCAKLPERYKEWKGFARINRAMAYARMGEFQKARMEVGGLNGPFRPAAIQLTGFTHFAERRYAAANAQFNYSDWTFLWRYLTLRHLDKEGDAAEILKRKKEDEYFPEHWGYDWLHSLRLKGWIKYMRGQMNDAEFLANVHPRKGQYVQPELCVAYFLVGEEHLLNGDRKGARKYFQKASETHAYWNAEWVIANARVKQLGANRHGYK